MSARDGVAPRARRCQTVSPARGCGSDHSYTRWYRRTAWAPTPEGRSSDCSGVGGGWGVLLSPGTHGFMDEHAERSSQGGCKEARAPYGHLPPLDAFDLIPQERHVILKNARPPDAGSARYPSDGKKDLTLVDGDKFSFVLSFGRHVKLAEAERTPDGQTNPDFGSGRRNGSQWNVAETPGKQYQQCRYARVLQSRRGHRQSLSSTRRPCQPEACSMRSQHGQQVTSSIKTEAGGLEPPRAFARRISSAVPYQLDYASGRTGSIGLGDGDVLLPLSSIGAPGFEPGTSATRTQRSTGLSHAPKLDAAPRRHEDN